MTLKPARQLTVYILPHSHTDIGYTAIQTDIEEKQINNLLQGMADARRTADYPEGARFVWNVEVLWAADLFLQRLPPKQRDEFLDAVKRGQVALNGMYLNELTGLCRPEELVRLFRYATQLGERTGVPVDSAMISDVPGYTWGTVTAMAQAGIRYFSVAPNYFDRIGDILVQWENKPFWWVGPDGQSQGAGLDSVLGLRHVAPLRQDVAAVGRGLLRRAGEPRLPLRHRLRPLGRPRRQRRARSGDLRFREGVERDARLAAVRHLLHQRGVPRVRETLRRPAAARCAATGRPTGKTAPARRPPRRP